MTDKIRMSDVFMAAFELIVSREGDVDTEDGSFATCGTDEIIKLDYTMAEFFSLDSDDTCLHHCNEILVKSKNYDQLQDRITRLESEREELIDILGQIIEQFEYDDCTEYEFILLNTAKKLKTKAE